MALRNAFEEVSSERMLRMLTRQVTRFATDTLGRLRIIVDNAPQVIYYNGNTSDQNTAFSRLWNSVHTALIMDQREGHRQQSLMYGEQVRNARWTYTP